MPVLQELLVLGALRILALLGGDTALGKAVHPRTCILVHFEECASSLALVDGPRVSQHRDHCDAPREQSVRSLAVVGKSLAPEMCSSVFVSRYTGTSTSTPTQRRRNWRKASPRCDRWRWLCILLHRRTNANGLLIRPWVETDFEDARVLRHFTSRKWSVSAEVPSPTPTGVRLHTH
jgi:hypothetical protein